MNQSSDAGNAAAAASTSSALDAASWLTTVHLVWLAVFAAIVVVGIVYGARLKHRRVEAERRTIEHARAAGLDPKPAAAAAEPVPPPPPPPSAAPTAAPTPAPAPEALPVPPPAPPSPVADETSPAGGPVTQLKGLGPKVAARLGELGIATVGQIAALDHDGARRLDAQLGPFAGRLERDRWIEQARFLAAGDRAGFEAVFGKL